MARLKLITALALAAPLLVLSVPQQAEQHILTGNKGPCPPHEPTHTTWELGSLANTTFHHAYHPLSQIKDFLLSLKHAYPKKVELEHIGYSSEGRDILAAVITRPQLKRGGRKYKKKPRFLVLGAQHGREWIATSTALYLAHALAADAHDPGSQSALLDLFDFYIIPTANPDGYRYTWEEDRFWYKNTMPIREDSECKGVDMNRNWGYEWQPSSSPVEGPCAAWYPGTQPFQAPEVKALANYVERIGRLKAFIDLRSYGQTISVPYSYSCDVYPKDAEDLLEAAIGAAAALHEVHGTAMKAGMLCDTLYKAPGNVLDWMYAERRIKYSFAVHLRDTGTYGFELPPRWILPVGEETAEMVSYLADFALKRPRKKPKV